MACDIVGSALWPRTAAAARVAELHHRPFVMHVPKSKVKGWTATAAIMPLSRSQYACSRDGRDGIEGRKEECNKIMLQYVLCLCWSKSIMNENQNNVNKIHKN